MSSPPHPSGTCPHVVLSHVCGVQHGAQSVKLPHPSGCFPQASAAQAVGVQQGQLIMPPHPSGCGPQASLPQANGVQVPVPAQKMAQASPVSAARSPS